MTLILHATAATDRGLHREHNEDAVHVGPAVVALADGIGGLPAGEVASALVVDTLAQLEDAELGSSAMETFREAVERANALIRKGVEEDPSADGMGTTLTAFLVAGNQLVLSHIGDSRAYLLRDGTLTQLSKDDTYVQMLVDQGAISPEQAFGHPHRSVVTRALQGQDVQPVFTSLRPRNGDRFLLCSDGLSDVVRDEVIASTLREYRDRELCAKRLVELALDAGGPDNITVAVADAETDGESTVTLRIPDDQPSTIDLPAVPAAGDDEDGEGGRRWLPWTR